VYTFVSPNKKANTELRSVLDYHLASNELTNYLVDCYYTDIPAVWTGRARYHLGIVTEYQFPETWRSRNTKRTDIPFIEKDQILKRPGKSHLRSAVAKETDTALSAEALQAKAIDEVVAESAIKIVGERKFGQGVKKKKLNAIVEREALLSSPHGPPTSLDDNRVIKIWNRLAARKVQRPSRTASAANPQDKQSHRC